MALLEEKKFEGNGMVKELEESAIGLILQNLQQDQYQYPIKSYIREVVSNSVDGIAEKHTARAILEGRDKVSDHYASTESAITEDSKFDESYYDLGYLSEDDTITITYLRRSGNRDQVIITDHGVGLGGKRLKGYFKPAYSSKRLNKKALGKFGIGAKSGLSTGVESYQMISCHNGRKYHFDIYNDRYHSMTPKFDMEAGVENPHEIWKAKRYADDGSMEEFDNAIHYVETDAKNSVQVFIDVKNPTRNRSKYIEAVKSQLTYFQNIKFIELDEENPEFRTDHEVMSEIMFQNESMIIPVDSYYNVPHLVLNNVNYGPIDFGEMEMQSIKGNVGIIGDPSEIDVNQSRESVRYTDRTRDFMKGYINNAATVAQDYLQQEFKSVETDFLGWIQSCKSLRHNVGEFSSDSVISRLSGFADLSNLEMTFPGTNFKFHSKSFRDVFRFLRISKVTVTKTDKGAYKTSTEDVKSWGEFSANNLIYRHSTEEKITAIRAAYIARELLPNCGNVLYFVTPEDSFNTLFTEKSDLDPHQDKIIDLVLDNARGLDLEEVKVPQDFVDEIKEAQKEQDLADKEKKEKEEKKAYEDSLTLEDIRKRDGKFLYYAIRVLKPSTSIERDYSAYYRYYEDNISKKKMDMEFDEVSTYFSKDTTIYGTQEDIPLMNVMTNLVSNIEQEDNTRGYAGSNLYGNYLWGSGLKLIIVSKTVAKFIDNNATHVKEALQSFEGTKLKLMSKIRDFNTARQYVNKFKSLDYKFLHLFSEIDKSAYDSYNELLSFAERNGFSYKLDGDVPGKDEVFSYLDKLTEFQLFVNGEKDVNAVAAKAQEMLGSDSVTDAGALNMRIYAKFKALEDFTENLRPMLKPFSIAYNSGGSTSGDSVDPVAVVEYMKLKGVAQFDAFLADRNDEFGVEPEPEDTQDNDEN